MGAFESIQQALQEAIGHAQGDDHGTRVHLDAANVTDLKEDTLERLPLLLAELGKHHSGERPEFEAENRLLLGNWTEPN